MPLHNVSYSKEKTTQNRKMKSMENIVGLHIIIFIDGYK